MQFRRYWCSSSAERAHFFPIQVVKLTAWWFRGIYGTGCKLRSSSNWCALVPTASTVASASS